MLIYKKTYGMRHKIIYASQHLQYCLTNMFSTSFFHNLSLGKKKKKKKEKVASKQKINF